MKQTNLKIKNLIGNDEKLTFLIGAGCSVDAPSNVPDSNKIKRELIKNFCAESEIENILKIEDLGLDHLLSIICNSLDEDHKIFDFFGLFDQPNLQHFFLADLIKEGHLVMTTNFDFLIEGALSKLNIPYKEIIPVITEEDFVIYSNPTELLERGYKAIYKIHGTPKNVITGEDTRDSVIKTIKTLGSGKIKKSLFQIEPFKRELLDNICEGRSLVIMGYSGVNDSDIIPTLRVLKNLKKIIWINHSESIQPGYEKIYEIASGKSQNSKNIDKHLISTAKNLQEIRLMSNASKIYLTSLNTSKMVKDLIQIKPKLKLDLNSLSIMDWFKENIKIPNVYEKVSIAARIYYDFGFLNEAMKCSEIMNRFTTLAEVKSWKLMAQEAITKSYLYQLKNPEALNQQAKGDTIGKQRNILTMRSHFLDITANIHHSMGNYSEALNRLEETLDVNEKLDNPKGIATGLKSIANIHYQNKKYNSALKNYLRALKIDKQLGELSSKAKVYISIGECFLAQKNYPKATKSYLSALKINRELGILQVKAVCLNRLGEIMRIQKKYSKALKFANNAVKANDELRNLTEKAISIKIIASINADQGDYPQAIKYYNNALKIYENLGNLVEIANSLRMIVSFFKLQGNYSEALKRNKRALKAYNQIGDLKGKANCLFDIANVNFGLANYQEALKYYEEALTLGKKSKNLTEISISLKNVGTIHQIQGNFSKALTNYKEALKIDEQLGKIKDQVLSLHRIAMIYFDQKNYPNSMAYFNKTLLIYEQLADLQGVASCFDNIGNILRLKGYYPEALKQYKKCVELYDELGDLSSKSECLLNIGEVFTKQAKFPTALKMYEDALKLKRELRDVRGEAICLNNIGNILRLKGTFSEALKLCTNALKVMEESEDFNVKAACHKNIALIHHDQGNYPEALKHYKETLLIFRNYGLIEGSEIRDIKNKIESIFLLLKKKDIPISKEDVKLDISDVKHENDVLYLAKENVNKKDLFPLGIIYKVQGKYEKALNYYEKALKQTENSNDSYKRIDIISRIGEIYKIMGKYLEAVKKYEEALKIARQLEDKSQQFKFVSKIRVLYRDFINTR